MLFKPLESNAKAEFEKYTKNKYENSETSFANLFIWRDFFDTRYTVCGEFLIVLYTPPDGGSRAYMPWGDGDFTPCVLKLKEYFASRGERLKIISASEEQAKILQDAFGAAVCENVDFNDYVYTSESLINLSGKKLHAKKNHLNRFKNTYDYRYRAIEKNDFDECLALASRLMLAARSARSLSYRAEYKSICNAFEYFDYLELCGGVIEIGGKIAAFTVGEQLTDDCALIHIEKADTAYDGIYAAINNEFAKRRWSGVKYINREEDMGLEGLRRAKMSYRPDHMVKKYICEF